MDNAERSIDAQYFLMKPDDAGLVFAHTMFEAADRGVQVRFLLDDNNKITWHATIDRQQVVETKEPLTSGWKRFKAWVMKIAPENQL